MGPIIRPFACYKLVGTNSDLHSEPEFDTKNKERKNNEADELFVTSA